MPRWQSPLVQLQQEMIKNLMVALAMGTALAAATTTTSVAQAEEKPATTLAVNPANNGPLKIGYTSVYYILSASPRAKEIESDLKARNTQLEKELQKKMADFEEKYTGFQRGQNTMSETIKADKYNELKNLESSIKEFQKNAEQEMSTKREELVAPEIEKITKAIKEVASENGYTYILNGDPQIMIFGADQFDVTDLVFKKLGIAKPVPGANAGGTDSPSKPANKPSTFPKGGGAKKPGAK